MISAYNRHECVRRIKSTCRCIHDCVKNRGYNPASWMPAELEYRSTLVMLRARLLEIETQERDALSIELQKLQPQKGTGQ
jgi:hypothetical protein